MTSRLLLVIGLVLGVLGLPPVAAAEEPRELRNDTPWPLVLDAGLVRELDFAGNTMLVSGLVYTVPIDVRVEIGGGAGAFTLLEPGMKIEFEYLQISAEERRMLRIRQLPPHGEIDEG